MSDLFDPWPGAGPEAVGLSIESVAIESMDEVWALIQGVPHGQGWVCLTQRVARWPGVEPHGPVLSAEIAGADGTSLHIRRVGHTWRGWRYREEPTGMLMRFRETMLGTVPDARQKLVYAVYWKLERGPDEISTYRPHAARFVGWEEA